MSCGPEIEVARNEAHKDRANRVVMSGFNRDTIAPLFPIGTEADVALLPPVIQQRMLHPNADRYFHEVVLSPHTAAWAIRKDGELAGLASLHTSPVIPDAVGYLVVVAPQFQRGGVGELVTAGVIEAASRPGLLARGSLRMPKEVVAVTAQVHGAHTVARHMVERAGFLEVSMSGPSEESPAVWVDYARMMPAFEIDTPHIAPEAIETAAAQAAAAALRFTVGIASR